MSFTRAACQKLLDLLYGMVLEVTLEHFLTIGCKSLTPVLQGLLQAFHNNYTIKILSDGSRLSV